MYLPCKSHSLGKTMKEGGESDNQDTCGYIVSPRQTHLWNLHGDCQNKICIIATLADLQVKTEEIPEDPNSSCQRLLKWEQLGSCIGSTIQVVTSGQTFMYATLNKTLIYLYIYLFPILTYTYIHKYTHMAYCRIIKNKRSQIWEGNGRQWRSWRGNATALMYGVLKMNTVSWKFKLNSSWRRWSLSPSLGVHISEECPWVLVPLKIMS